jgi:hypothetical protein
MILRPVPFSVVAILALSLVSTAALAIGPSDQKIPDDPTPLSIRATGQLADESGIGTGTVVSTKLVGTTGYVGILTARHVATSQPTTLKLGSLIGGAAPWMEFATSKIFQSFVIVDKDKNPKKLPEDVALMVGKVSNLKDGSPELAKFKQLAGTVPAVIDPTKGDGNPFAKATDAEPVGFTQIGYGRLADYKTMIDIGDDTFINGYQATDVSGERLFQNNLVREYLAAAVIKDALTGNDVYFHPKVRFNAIGPPNNDGQGAAMGGDSGSPLFTQKPDMEVKVPVTRDGNKIQIPVQYTNSLSAVFVASQPVTITELVEGNPMKVELKPETIGKGGVEFAVPIDAALYKWMQPYLADPRSIPEPSTFALLVVGGLIVWFPSRVAGRKRSQ